MVAQDNSIVVEALVREFKKGPRAVDGIDLHVEPGEIYGFLGPNGAGKSTTVLMLTTLLPPTSGTARVGGYDVVREGPKVRSVIGAALQEAALDPMLTGRDHLRLQTTLQGIPRAERKPRADELLERVGLSEAADRKVGGYSGGMKRRLDLALALVHRPRILFLDEPTTGLDPQSRTALWEEVGRLAREEGVTVFLTTQYLEEADVLADRVGIIDHGRIVAEGTPAALKAEIGLPSVHAIPAARGRARRGSPPCSRRSASRSGDGSRDVAVRLRAGPRRASGRGSRASTTPASTLASLEIQAPSLDDVFLAKTGRSLEGAGEAEADASEPTAMTHESGRASPRRSRALARRSILRTVRQPASVVFPLIFPMMLLLVNSGGLDASTELPGFPTDSFVAFALAVPFIQGALFSTMNAGTDLARDIQTGFLNRLSLTSMRGVALIAGQLAGVVVLASSRRRSTSRSVWSSASTSRPGALGILVLFVLRRADLDRLRRARRLPRAPHRLGRGDPGPLPAPLRLPLPLLDEHAARPDRGRLVPRRRDAESGLVPDRVRAEPDHHRLGRDRRSCSASASPSLIGIVAIGARERCTLRERLART